MIIKELIEFGLSEKEAKAYLALLELEIAEVNEIAKNAGVNRTSAYTTLETLKKKGLVSISDDKKVRKYIATPPEAVLRIAEDHMHQYADLYRKIQSVLPEMKALYRGNKKKPFVRVFEGKHGLISAFEDTLDSKEKFMRVSSSPGNLGKIIGDYLPKYIHKRYDSKIKMHGIHPDDEVHRKLVEDSPKNFDTSLLVPREKYEFPADIAIYDDKVGFMSNEDGGIAIVIESKVIADVMKSVFDLAWEEAKRRNKNPI